MKTSCTLRTSKPAAGFSLIELILVVGILALMATIAITNIDFLAPKYRARAAAREVGDLARTAKARAVAMGKDVFIQYDLSTNEYWLLVPSEKEEDGKKKTVYEKMFQNSLKEFKSEFRSVVVSRDVRFDRGGKATIKFSPMGYGGSHVVNLQGEESRLMAVKVNGFTGALSFYDEEKDADELLEDNE